MLNLTPEQNALFSVLRNEKVNETSFVDWDEVRKEALAQTVFLMFAKLDCLPTEIAKTWTMTFHAAMRDNIEAFYAITEMDRVMRSAGEKYVILKGLAAASYYPDPMLRALGDVDFLIDPGHQGRVKKALEDDGYERWNTAHICHVVFQKENQNLEMHFEIAGIPHGKPGELVREYMKSALDETVSYSENGFVLNLPLPQYHGLIILLHMQHHMVAEGLGLRHLIDWCYFVQKTENDEFWKTDLLPILKKIGLLRFAEVMTMTGTLYLHTPCPDWCKNVDEELCDGVMKDILEGGNFGRKNEERSESGMMISDHGKDGTQYGKLYHLWKTLLSGINGYWPIVKKHSILYLVFIPVFMIRRAFRVLTGKRIPIWKSLAYADERKSVYDRLHLFEV